MKHILIIFLLFLPLSVLAQQPQPHPQGAHAHFNPQEFQQRMEQTITREACLTADEAAAFFPIFNEMKQKQRAMANQIRTLKRQTSDNGSATEADYLAAITRIKQLQVEMAQVEQDYYKRLCNAVPAAKVFKAMQSEDRFHRSMVREARRKKD